MTSEPEKKLNEHIEFLSSNPDEPKYKYITTEDGREGRIAVTVKEETIVYEPIFYCECMLFTWNDKAKKAILPNGENDLGKQAKLYVEVKWRITLVTERFLRKMQEHSKCKSYDFSGIFRQVEGAIEESKLFLEIQLLDSQTKANKSTVTTNRILITILSMTALIYLGQLYIAFKSLPKDEQLFSPLHIKPKDTLILPQGIKDNKIQNQVYRVSSRLDSLNNAYQK